MKYLRGDDAILDELVGNLLPESGLTQTEADEYAEALRGTEVYRRAVRVRALRLGGTPPAAASERRP